MRLVRVAVDGSRASGNALAWAAAVALAWGADLEVVTVLGLHGPVFVDQPRDDDVDEQDFVEAGQRALLASVGARADGLRLQHRVAEGQPAAVLKELDPVPDLLVTGTRGVGGFVGLLVGSTAHQLADHAPCPVAVVPDASDPPGPVRRVVVGIDGSHASEVALDWTLRGFGGATVEGVVVRDGLLAAASSSAGAGMLAVGAVAAASPSDLTRTVEQRVPASVDRVAWTVTEGRAAPTLLERALDADLLVLGIPGSDHATPMRLGSVAHRCLGRAPVPVVVVR